MPSLLSDFDELCITQRDAFLQNRAKLSIAIILLLSLEHGLLGFRGGYATVLHRKLKAMELAGVGAP